MRIAFICTEMMTVPPLRGGAIQILIDGVAPHIGRKHRLTVFCITDPSLPDRERVKGVEYIRVPREGYVRGVAQELARLQSAASERDPKKKRYFDIIHVFNRPKDVLIYKKAMPKSRFVVSVHNEMFRGSKVKKELGEVIIQSVDRIMCISDYIGRTIVERFPSAKGKLHTVYSGIHLKKYMPIGSAEAQPVRQQLREKYGVVDKKVVLFVGRLSRVKGPDVLIEAMKQVVMQHDNAVLAVIGSKWFYDERVDEYGQYLRRIAEPLGGRVLFTGFVPPSEIPSYYLLGDLFVCSSQWEEPLARVHYEAMGAGLPIITTNRGGNAEIMKRDVSGIVIDDYDNPKAIADAISLLLSRPDKAMSLAKAGRAMAEANFGFQHVAKRLLRMYDEMKRRSKQK
ncbi:Spore coat protein SA [Paenibacillus solanacearum]|uniref:Spore coat protein SA n=2 Tax=Paenibacillus solanacearum TaxID=2048548 RepID=A0A916K2N1_9BACL|nr:Spore coat protein SA [Paenibacillus solanacearum]